MRTPDRMTHSRTITVLAVLLSYQLGLTSSVMESITREGITLSVFDGVKEDPPESTVLQLIDFAKELRWRNPGGEIIKFV